MKKYIKYVIAAAVTATAIILVAAIAKRAGRKTDAKEIVSLVVSNKEKLAELVTYRYSRDTVLYETRKPSKFVAKFTDEPDTVAVFIARPVICAGVDLRNLQHEDVTVRNDTLFVSLPAPEILDLYLNSSDITEVYSSWDWKLDDKLGAMSERAKAGLRRDALRQGILLKAGAQAERSMSEFLERLCKMPVVVRCRQREEPLQLPQRD